MELKQRGTVFGKNTMNIKFTDKKIFEVLKENALTMTLVGSRAYGSAGETSDYDYLYIYPTPKNELQSAFQTHRQLQYKDEKGNDHLFVSLHKFIRNIVSGDNLLNFEAFHSSNVQHAPYLNRLAPCRHYFSTRTIVRSYLGRCRTDIKAYNHLKLETDHVKKVKKLKHIIRGYFFAKDIMDGVFSSITGDIQGYWFKVDNCVPGALERYLIMFEERIEELRARVIAGDGEYGNYMLPEAQELIDKHLLDITRIQAYKHSKAKIELISDQLNSLFYHENEYATN